MPSSPTFRVSSRPGEPDDLALSHERVPFAGHFGRRRTGTAVLTVDDQVVAAVAFSSDRRDAARCRVRHWAVRRDRQGEGLGPTAIDEFADWAVDGAYDAVLVNAATPHAAVALHRAGFGFTGECGPQGEVAFARPTPAGGLLEDALEALLERPLPSSQRRYAREHLRRS
ncbi:MAG: GNAT family N-acetyltransferase [Halobacteriales archaeon]